MASTEMLQDQAELPGKETSGTLNPEAKEFQMVTDEPTERLEEADTTIADPLKPQEEHNLQPATMETNSSKDQEARRAIDVPALSASMPLSAQFEQPSGIELPSDILRTSVSSLSASASAPTLDPLLAASSWPLKQSTAPENAADALLQPKLSKSSPAAPVEGFTAPDAMQELGSPLEENEQERDGTSSSQTATQQLIVSEQTTQQPTDASYQPEIRDEAEVRKQNGAVDTSQAHDTQTESDPGSDEAASVVEEDSTQPQALTDLLSHVEMPAWLAAYCEPSEDALLPTEDNNELENVRAPPVLLSSGGQTYWLFAPLIPEGQEAPAETGALSDANPVVSTPSVDAGEDKSRPNATATGLSTYPLLLSDDHELYFAPLSRVFDRLHDQFPSFHDEQMEIRLCVSELGVEIPEDNAYASDISMHDLDRLHLGCDLPGRLHITLSEAPRFIYRFNTLARHVAKFTSVQPEHGEGDLAEDPPVDDNDITEALVEDDQFLLDDVPLTEDQDADIEAELPGDVPVAEVTEDVVDDTAEVAPEQYEDAIEVFESTDAPTSAADGKLEHPVVTQSESAEAQKGLPESTLLEADMVPPSQMDEVGAGPEMTSVEPLETTGAAISNDSAVLTPTEAGDDDRTPDGLVNGSGSTTNGADVTSKRRRSRSEAFEEVDGEGQEQETPDATHDAKRTKSA